jgi:hypothetical protein
MTEGSSSSHQDGTWRVYFQGRPHANAVEPRMCWTDRSCSCKPLMIAGYSFSLRVGWPPPDQPFVQRFKPHQTVGDLQQDMHLEESKG